MLDTTTYEKLISPWTYVIVLGVWLSLRLTAIATVVTLNIRDAQKELIQYGQAYSDHLVFMEPLPSGSQEILGLDIESVPFLKRVMFQSIQRRGPVATQQRA